MGDYAPSQSSGSTSASDGRCNMSFQVEGSKKRKISVNVQFFPEVAPEDGLIGE